MSKFTDGLIKGAECALGGELAFGVIDIIIKGQVEAYAYAMATIGAIAGEASGATEA